ncbi:MAG: ABC transporter permease, partial [Candidatus Eisenbacteria bacterium]|nr:ABC transporter permease [Candidatus Eisenbacteria bacterium]
MSETVGQRPRRGLLDAIRENPVPILFGILCLVGIVAARISPPFLLNEIVTRLSRNLFLVLSLIVPVVAGMGLNFGIVIGAMCGQIGLLIVENANATGLGALTSAVLLSLPLSIGSGVLIARLLNQAKGREMITGMILGFFANGVYQLLFLLLAGPVIPLRNERILLTTGVGLKNTVDLLGTKNQLDFLVRPAIQLPNGKIFVPLVTFLVIALAGLFIR